MTLAYNPSHINWEMLAGIGESLGEGYHGRKNKAAMRSAIESGDWNSIYSALAGESPAAAAELMRRREGDVLDYKARAAKANAPKAPSPTALKAKWGAEDDVNQRVSSLDSIKRARDLIGENNDGIYDKEFAGIATSLGTDWNYMDWAGSDFGKSIGLDPEKAERTQEWQMIMSPAAMEKMSNELKGSTAYQEMLEYKKILANPKTLNSVKKTVLDRMINLWEREIETKRGRISEIEGAGPEAGEGEWADEGEEVEGPDGRTYIIQGGQLVPQ